MNDNCSVLFCLFQVRCSSQDLEMVAMLIQLLASIMNGEKPESVHVVTTVRRNMREEQMTHVRTHNSCQPEYVTNTESARLYTSWIHRSLVQMTSPTRSRRIMLSRLMHRARDTNSSDYEDGGEPMETGKCSHIMQLQREYEKFSCTP